MDFLSPLQPHEWVAIVATLADFATTTYGVLSGRAREGNPLAILVKGRKGLYIWIAIGVALHFFMRARFDADYGPRMQAQAWIYAAAPRALVSMWNTYQLLRTKNK